MRTCYYIVPSFLIPMLNLLITPLSPLSCVPCAESVYVVSLMIFDDFLRIYLKIDHKS